MKTISLLLTLIIILLLSTLILSERFRNPKEVDSDFKLYCKKITPKHLKIIDSAVTELKFASERGQRNKPIANNKNLIYLGNGGYSNVFYDKTKQEVIKVIKYKKYNSMTSLFSIRKEILFGFDYFLKTKNKGAVKSCAYNFNSTEEHIRMVILKLDYLKGYDMNYYSKSKPKNNERNHQKNLYTLKNVISLIQEFNDLGYIHRDIKPHNIFLENNEFSFDGFRPYLIDLALAIDFKYSNIYYGTERYMSEEMLIEEWYNNTIDVYSLGVTFFEFLRFDFIKFEIDWSLAFILESMLSTNYCQYHEEFDVPDENGDYLYNLHHVVCFNSDLFWESFFQDLTSVFRHFFYNNKNFCSIQEIEMFFDGGKEDTPEEKTWQPNRQLIFWNSERFNKIKCFDLNKNNDFELSCRPSIRDLKKLFNLYYNWKFSNPITMYNQYEVIFRKRKTLNWSLFWSSKFIGVMYRHNLPNLFNLVNSDDYIRKLSL